MSFEAWNKYIEKSASSCSLTRITSRCTVNNIYNTNILRLSNFKRHIWLVKRKSHLTLHVQSVTVPPNRMFRTFTLPQFYSPNGRRAEPTGARSVTPDAADWRHTGRLHQDANYSIIRREVTVAFVMVEWFISLCCRIAAQSLVL